MSGFRVKATKVIRNKIRVIPFGDSYTLDTDMIEAFSLRVQHFLADFGSNGGNSVTLRHDKNRHPNMAV